MLQRYHTKAVGLAICLALWSGTAAASEISLEGEYWNPHITGEIKSTAKVDVKNDLNLGNESIATLKLGFKGDHGPKYFIQYENPSFSNTKNVTSGFGFNGENYASGEQITSNVDVKHFQFGLQNEKMTSGGKFSTIYSYNHNQIRTGIQDMAGNQSREDRSDAVSIGFSWESVNTKGINFFAESTPLSIGSHGGYLDYNVGLKTKMGKTLTLTLGYKGEKLEAGKTSSSVGSEIHLKGMYVFLGSGF